MSRPLPTQSRADAAQASEVRAELARIIASPAFDGSPRHTSLLRFLVEEVLEGRGSALQACGIATRFFNRGESFDTAEDSIVRVEVSRLRRALDRHYALSAATGLRIELPRGSYAPRFVATPMAAPASGRRPASSADFPRIAVVPFVGLDTCPETLTLAQGLTSRLGTLFARRPTVSVVSHAVSLDDARERGARYVLEGAVRFAAGFVRVTAHLHDTTRGVLAWGQTYDRPAEGAQLFDAEDQIAADLFQQIVPLPFGAVHLLEAQERAGAPLQGAYDVALRFPRWLSTFDPILQYELRRACELVLRDDADQWLFLSLLHSLSLWTADAAPDAQRIAAELARKAVALQPGYTAPHQALSFVFLAAGDREAMLRHARIALSVDGDAAVSGLLLSIAGDWEAGMNVLGRQMRLTRRYPGGFHHALFLDAYRRRDYLTALSEAQSIATPRLAWDALDRAAALGKLGRLAEAHAAADELRGILPDFAADARGHLDRLVVDAALREDLLDGLRLAGIETSGDE